MALERRPTFGSEVVTGGSLMEDFEELPPRAEQTASGQSVVLYLRGSPNNPERETGIVGALRQLVDRGVLEDAVVETWPGTVSFERDTDARSAVIDTFRLLETWADEHDVSICPPFLHRERASVITDEREEVLRTPAMFLVVRDETGIAGMYPCHHGDGATSIEEWLAQFDTLDDVHTDPPTSSGTRR